MNQITEVTENRPVDNMLRDCVEKDELMTIEELCSYLKVVKSWVYYQTHMGKLPHVKVGRHLRFEKSKVMEFLRGQNGTE